MAHDVIVYDLQSNAHPFSWAEQQYGVGYREPPLQPGMQVFRLISLQEEEGASVYKCVVLWTADPIPYTGITGAFWWPTAPFPPETGEGWGLEPTQIPQWHNNFVYGKTNVDGVWGTGYGGGAAHGPGEGGPHEAWIYHPTIASDLVTGLGWLAGTFHRCLNPTFCLVTVGGTPTPEPPPTPLPDGMAAELAAMGAKLIEFSQALGEIDALVEEAADRL